MDLQKGVKVLSLFDGMSCGMLAIQKAGMSVDKYYAYEIDKYAIQTSQHNFPDIIQCGDVFEADFTKYKDIDFVIGGSPCVPAGTKVKTDKGYKKIEDICIGDMVLTHKNRYRPVSRLYKRQSNHLFTIKFNGNMSLNITGNHPVYTYRNNKFEFIRTDELTTDDFVCININQNKQSLSYSDDILWLAGRTIADGYMLKDKKGVCISVGKAKTEEFESHLTELSYYICHKDRSAPDYIITNPKLIELYSYFGDYKALSKFIPDSIINLPIEQLSVIFNGYISGDGFKRKDKPNTIMWSSSSEDLTLSIGLITAKLFNKYPTVSVRQPETKQMPNGCIATSHISYNSQISITDRYNPDIQIVEDKLLIKIKNIEKISKDVTVYNIEAAEDHSYTINNCIVKNCTYWSIAQKAHRETEASGMGWELFSQYVRALNEVKPRFFIYENNKSMSAAIRQSISETFGFEPICINSALVSAQNRQRLYWVGKRNDDNTYSKVDILQPDDKGILLRDILDTGCDLTSNNKAWTLTASYNGAVSWNTIERSQRNMVIEPVGTTKNGKSYCLTAGYSNGSGENIGNYAVHTLEKGCKSMVAEPINTTNDGKSQTIKAQYQNTSTVNICCYKSTYGATGIAEPVRIPEYGEKDKARPLNAYYSNNCGGFEHRVWSDNPNKQQVDLISEPVLKSIRVGALPLPNGELSTSQAMRVYSTEGKSVNLCSGSGGMGGKTGLYAIPIEFENNKPIKAISCADGKTYTVYEVKNGQITIKGKQYQIKLTDGYYIIRKLTVSECKRLQTVPEWYEFPVSNTQAYKLLGNGWTVDVIAHILKELKI